MEALGRFFTNDIFSKILIQGITIAKPETIVDLGIGEGALTKAAFAKWNQALFFAIDIDLDQISKTEAELPFVKIVQASGLKNGIDKKLKIKAGTIDVAVCNPPYLKVQSNNGFYSELFNKVRLPNCSKLKYLTADLIFLAQNLRLLKTGGELGIILPDGMLTSHEFRRFREDLITNHFIKSIIQLPDDIFKGTEARTHIMIIKKGNDFKNIKTCLYLANTEGVLVDELYIDSKHLIERMDFLFHSHKFKSSSTGVFTLKDIGANIQRGKSTHAELKIKASEFIHTTKYKHGEKLNFDTSSILSEETAYAKTNDILLSRVGRGCIGKAAFIQSGKVLISDCVYKITVPNRFLDLVWKAILAPEGQEWLRAMSHGVCAKVVSKKDLFDFPIRF